MGQSPPGTPQGPHSGIHRHRSTPSGSSDAGSNKYRKLQPAPVPAHRNWANKPELKTIPYDHKETGSSAALPSSGPTQIRGWNVNQPRKRSKAEKQERSGAATTKAKGKGKAKAKTPPPAPTKVQFRDPLPGLPPLCPRDQPHETGEQKQGVYKSLSPVPEAQNEPPARSTSVTSKSESTPESLRLRAKAQRKMTSEAAAGSSSPAKRKTRRPRAKRETPVPLPIPPTVAVAASASSLTPPATFMRSNEHHIASRS
ncbi:hypothetical protein NLG97_g11081 [Lecanicillium saksenae]|uniref:Uncharacterized protein n=1 Tax=Lecanicillium saksenae TaxID=468837 RepID=A0ACC1QE44_9HYPO|nr:hypothetical protein NLG97_g11081 [Lecanicillium saksenae]